MHGFSGLAEYILVDNIFPWLPSALKMPICSVTGATVIIFWVHVKYEEERTNSFLLFVLKILLTWFENSLYHMKANIAQQAAFWAATTIIINATEETKKQMAETIILHHLGLLELLTLLALFFLNMLQFIAPHVTFSRDVLVYKIVPYFFIVSLAPPLGKFHFMFFTSLPCFMSIAQSVVLVTLQRNGGRLSVEIFLLIVTYVIALLFAFSQATTPSTQLVSINLLAEAVIFFIGIFQNCFFLRILINICVMLLSFYMVRQIECSPADYEFSIIVIVCYVCTNQKCSWLILVGVTSMFMFLCFPAFSLMIFLEKIIDFYCLSLHTSVVQFSKAKKCILCDETFTEGVLIPCGDSFHSRCFRKWTSIKLDCPECGKNYALSTLLNVLQT